MKILLIGGDKRQRELEKIMTEKGYDVSLIESAENAAALEEMTKNAGAVILPLPVSRDGVNVLSGEIKLTDLVMAMRGKKLLGGAISEILKKELWENGIEYYDYYADESFAVKNAFLTAQGALRLLLESTEEYIAGKRLLVTGFGRVGRAVSHIMKAAGFDVYVAARSGEQRSEAFFMGYKTLDLSQLSATVHIFDFFVNTVPSRLFSKADVGCIDDGAVYLELASKPFGAEAQHFERYKKRYVSGGSLPGRFCAVSSAQAVYSAIKDELNIDA